MVCFGSYIRHIDRVILLLLVFLVNTAISDRVSVHYDVTPGAGLAGLKCVSENVQFRRAVRFNKTFNVCEMLDESWNTNVTFEPDYVYMQMLSYEEPFKENFTARSSFPLSFDVGCFFDVVFRTPASRPRWFSFKVVDWSSAVNTTFLHVHFRASENITALKSRYFGTWSEEVTTYNPITEYNAVYRVTVFWHNTHWSVFVDGTHLLNFTHNHAFYGKQWVHFWSNDVWCQQIIFYGP